MNLVSKNVLSRLKCVLNHEVRQSSLLELSRTRDNFLLLRTHSELHLCFFELFRVAHVRPPLSLTVPPLMDIVHTDGVALFNSLLLDEPLMKLNAGLLNSRKTDSLDATRSAEFLQLFGRRVNALGDLKPDVTLDRANVSLHPFFAISVVTGIVSRWFPRCNRRGRNWLEHFKHQVGSIAGGTSVGLRKALVAAQLALALLFLIGASLPAV